MSALTRITVNLAPRAVEALNRVAFRTGDSRTDTINRALVGWAELLRTVDAGGGELLLKDLDGPLRTVHIR